MFHSSSFSLFRRLLCWIMIHIIMIILCHLGTTGSRFTGMARAWTTTTSNTIMPITKTLRAIMRTTTTTTTTSRTRPNPFNLQSRRLRPIISSSSTSTSTTPSSCTTTTTTTSTQLDMVRTRGLEQRRESATPTEGGMILYVKAGPDGTSVGDCPFAHFVRLVLEEKGLEYDLQPTTSERKPNWLIEHYEGKMPALRHRKECYVESGVIADYLEFFFPEPSLKPELQQPHDPNPSGGLLLDQFFPAVAQYLKTVEDSLAHGEKLSLVEERLSQLNDHLAERPYFDGETFTLSDCRLVPQLYHLKIGIEGFKSGIPNLKIDYPNVETYLERCTDRPSFVATVYPKETVLWGWGNARQ